MTLDGHLLLSYPAESWPACAPPLCVCVRVFVWLPLCLAACVQLQYSCLSVFIYAYVHMHNTVGCVCVCVTEIGGLREMLECVECLFRFTCSCRTCIPAYVCKKNAVLHEC